MNSFFFKDSELKGNDIELFFHKDYPYLFNEAEFPVVKYTLNNCLRAQSFDFSWLLDEIDGSIVEISKEHDHSVVKITGMSGDSLEIKCDNILIEEMKYREIDLHYLIKELLIQQERDNETNMNLSKSVSNLLNYFEREIQIIDKKLTEASWLSSEKQAYLKGQKSILEKSIDILDPQ